MLRNFRRALPAYRLLVPRTTGRSFTRFNGAVQVQRVKVKKPWARRAATKIFTLLAATYVWVAAVSPALDRIEDVDDEIDEVRKRRADRGRVRGDRGGNGDEDDEATFIPLGLPYPARGLPYMEDGPEIKNFLKYKNNPEEYESLRTDLLSMCATMAARDPDTVEVTGTPLVPFGDSLRLFFFDRPIVYIQPGLEIDDGIIAWTGRVISQERGDWIRRILRPTAVITSSWLAVQVFYNVKMLKYLKSLRDAQQDRLARNNGGNSDATPTASRNHGTRPASNPLQNQGISNIGNSTNIHQSAKPNSALEEDLAALKKEEQELEQELEALLQSQTSDFSLAMNIFKGALRKSWVPSETPARGSFALQGTILFKGPAGSAEYLVHAFYDPERRDWDHVNFTRLTRDSFSVGLRRKANNRSPSQFPKDAETTKRSRS
ncbi:hypothetical protein FQN53_008294 [Emmonsiellopsis sp. PD_33]|nr:hypothetical protein FQN53_008294 [Emmonsiellopsis sp. PD_33]